VKVKQEAEMTSEKTPTVPEGQKIKIEHHGGGSDAVYGLGLFGAWVYYIGRATTPREKVIGFFKGFVWPAFLVYALLKFLEED
jgi:hypothetical protein